MIAVAVVIVALMLLCAWIQSIAADVAALRRRVEELEQRVLRK